jgi:hypothetical protein
MARQQQVDENYAHDRRRDDHANHGIFLCHSVSFDDEPGPGSDIQKIAERLPCRRKSVMTPD